MNVLFDSIVDKRHGARSAPILPCRHLSVRGSGVQNSAPGPDHRNSVVGQFLITTYRELLRLLGRGRSGHFVTCRFFDDRKLSTILRYLQLERVLGFGYILDGDAHTDLGVAHLGFGGPVPSVTVHRTFRIDSFAGAGELMVGVNLLVRIISHKGDALRWPHRPGAFRVAHNEEPTRVPFARL